MNLPGSRNMVSTVRAATRLLIHGGAAPAAAIHVHGFFFLIKTSFHASKQHILVNLQPRFQGSSSKKCGFLLIFLLLVFDLKWVGALKHGYFGAEHVNEVSCQPHS